MSTHRTDANADGQLTESVTKDYHLAVIIPDIYPGELFQYERMVDIYVGG